MVIANICKIDGSDDGDNEVNRDKFTRKNNWKMAKSKILVRLKNHDLSSKSKHTESTSNELGFFIAKAKLAFTKSRLLFIKRLILHHFV